MLSHFKKASIIKTDISQFEYHATSHPIKILNKKLSKKQNRKIMLIHAL